MSCRKIQRADLVPSDGEMLVKLVKTTASPLDREALKRDFPVLWQRLERLYPGFQSLLLNGKAGNLTRFGLRVLIIHEAGEADNPHLAEENGMYPTVRDLAARHLLLFDVGRKFLAEDAEFIVNFLGDDYVNHPVVGRAMKILGTLVPAE